MNHTPPREKIQRPRLAALRPLAASLLLLAFGCINDDVQLYEVTVRGRAIAPAWSTSNGALHLEFHHQLRTGRGALAHPLGEFDTRTEDVTSLPAPFQETVLYPTQAGQGLIVYGWLDVDDDGVLCAPGQTEEPAGLVVVPDFPRHQANIDLLLNTPCAGAERLY